jgi:hypothetical protein
MNPTELEPGLQIVLQRPDGGPRCEGFGGIPAAHPAYITISDDGTPGGATNAVTLGHELRRQILAMPGARQVPVPCSGYGGPFSCFALSRPYCHKVGVTVCDGSTGVAPMDLSKTSNGINLVCFPAGTNSKVVLPSWLSTTAAATWQTSVHEVVPAIFAAVHLAPAARLFISYRQLEAAELSEQLFEELGKIGFDVYVDRFRGTPGANFQRRILEEIAHKSMVLFLETATTASAPWTRYEVAVAKSLRVGLLALQLPGGNPIRDIDNGRRVRLRAPDFEPGTQTLDTAPLQAVLERIKTDHTLNEMRRRQLMRDNMRRALARVGAHQQSVVAGGAIHVVPNRTSSKEYLVSLPTRPAELGDFYEVVNHGTKTIVRAIVAPSAHFRDVRREQMRWLSAISDVRAFDEGAMLSVAKKIKAEAL